MPTVDGAYTRKTGKKLAYSYRLTFDYVGGDLIWSAIVTSGGDMKGQPGGSVLIPIAVPADLQRHAEDMTRASIEKLVDVIE
jgi:hypothetical protein